MRVNTLVLSSATAFNVNERDRNKYFVTLLILNKETARCISALTVNSPKILRNTNIVNFDEFVTDQFESIKE